jgi:hypothetical protein
MKILLALLFIIGSISSFAQTCHIEINNDAQMILKSPKNEVLKIYSNRDFNINIFSKDYRSYEDNGICEKAPASKHCETNVTFLEKVSYTADIYKMSVVIGGKPFIQNSFYTIQGDDALSKYFDISRDFINKMEELGFCNN